MRSIRLQLMTLVVVGALAFAGIGGTIATWSDSETSEGNYIETGSVDLLVAKCAGDWAKPWVFKDDGPHGVGLDRCFDVTLAPGGNYICYSLLWNAGCIDAVAYLHINNVSDSDALSSNTTMSIWYDDDGNPDTSLVPVGSGTIADLNCHEIELGGLPAEAVRQLKLEVEYTGGCPSHGFSFDIIFQLAGGGFADSEISQGNFSVPP